MSSDIRKIQTLTFWVIGLLGVAAVLETTLESYRTGGLFDALFMLVISGVLTSVICFGLGGIAYLFFRTADSISRARARARPITWENKVFPLGGRVVINREDPDYYENPMVISIGDSPHSAEIDCDNGRTGTVTGGGRGSLAVRWDAQEWREHRTRRQIFLPCFESSIHPDHMDLASGITPNNPLKTAKPRSSHVSTKDIDLANKDWLNDLVNNTPMRDFPDLPHEVLTNDYFIGLLSNGAVAAIGRDHHRLPREVVRKIAAQLCRRAEHDSSLAQFLEICKTAEPPWRFDWQRAAAR